MTFSNIPFNKDSNTVRTWLDRFCFPYMIYSDWVIFRSKKEERYFVLEAKELKEVKKIAEEVVPADSPPDDAKHESDYYGEVDGSLDRDVNGEYIVTDAWFKVI